MADLPTNLRDESVQARFWSKVDRRGEGECWPWVGAALIKDGRGVFWAGSRNYTAPNAALRLAVGNPPEGKTFACHSCDNPNCVNPAHLWWGSALDNARDAKSKNRLSGQKNTHCAQGHPLSGENMFITWQGGRGCRTCMKAHRQAYNQKARGIRGLAIGQRHGTAKLTDMQALEIYDSLEPRAVLAARYGVSKSVINRIKTGENWCSAIARARAALSPLPKDTADV